MSSARGLQGRGFLHFLFAGAAFAPCAVDGISISKARGTVADALGAASRAEALWDARRGGASEGASVTAVGAGRSGSDRLNSGEDRVAVSQCSLQKHAAAEVASLLGRGQAAGAAAEKGRHDGGDGAAASACAAGGAAALDVGSRGQAYLTLLEADLREDAAGTVGRQDALAAGHEVVVAGRPGPKRVVWVTGFPHSSTSTVLSMISDGQTVRDEHREHRDKVTYSLYEPCHDGDAFDEYEEGGQSKPCNLVLRQLTQCNFSDVKHLWGWTDLHSTREHSMQERFTKEAAASLCSASDVVAFKTVDQGHRLANWAGFLQDTPQLRVVDVIRDPRDLYASWKSLEPFASLVHDNAFYTIEDVCDSFEANFAFPHPQVHHLVFERLVREPREVMEEVYDFVGLSRKLGKGQLDWISHTFDAKSCADPKPWEFGHRDCHTNSRAETEKWRILLTQEELERFNNTPSCKRVMLKYGYVW